MPSAAAQDVLQAILEQRAAEKRREMAAPPAGPPAALPFAQRTADPASLPFADRWHNSLANRILSAPSKLFGGLVVDPAMDLATLAGDVIHGRQPTMAADPQTGEFHTDPGLINRTNNAAGMLTLGAGAVPAEANSLRMGIKGFRDIRPPKEDVWETVQGLANHGTVLGDANMDINKLSGGHRLSDPATRKRVDALKAKIGGDDGYIERLIVDDTGNVIEGAHRLDALRELGARNVPATLIRDLGRGVDTNKVEAAVRAAGQVRGEQSRQIVQNVLEMANDVGLDNIASQYTFPRGFEASHQAAIDALKGQTLETAEQVKARLAPRPGIRAYHGSPHDFERFDSSKIGTGEGAQAYGHGMYFAEREGVATDYRNKLAKAKFEADNLTDEGRRSYDAKIQMGIADFQKKHGAVNDGTRKAIADKILNDMPEAAFHQTGSMYQVDIAADPEHFLDWDKPLSEQSPQVQQAIEKAGISPRRESKWYAEKIGREQRPVWHNNSYYISQNGPKDFVYGKGSHYDQTGVIGFASTKEAAQKALEDAGMEMPFKTGQEALRELKYKTVGYGPDYGPEASKILREAGIPGVKYLDEGSRQAGKGTSNVVVFDDKLISILKKYGLPISAAGLAALSQLHPQEAQAAQNQRQ